MRPLSPTARRTPKLSVGHVTMLGMDIAAVIIALLTLVAGFAAGWALARTRSAAAVAERDAARAEVGTIRGERDQLGEALRAAEKASADAMARLESERTSATEKIALLEHAQVQLKEAFASLSRDALDQNQQQFLALADARFKQAGAPLTETLDKVEAQMRSIEKERADAHASLRTQIAIVSKASDDLKLETAALVSALRKPQARGRWGELQLRRCVEHAGMTERCDFFEQQSVSTADGILRPDLVVRLVGGESIVVDSKVTLAAYLEAHETTDDAVREERLVAHGKHLRQHVDSLAAKAYWSQFSPAPEFVVLFVPGDAFLAAALDRDPTLFDDAFSKRVHIASPTTLISVLRAVAYAWQQDALAENAREVFELGRELYSRIGKLGAKVDTLGRRLGSAVGAYNETVASLESRVLPQARKLKELKIVDDELADPKAIDEAVRPIAAAELVESAERARPVVTLPAAEATVLVDELERADDYGLQTDADTRPGRAIG